MPLTPELVALARQAQEQGGVPQRGTVPPEEDLSSLLMQLRSGQVSAEALIELLALLSGAGGGLPGMGAGAPPGQGPGADIQAAFMGQ